jgi:hypothetical protein
MRGIHSAEQLAGLSPRKKVGHRACSALQIRPRALTIHWKYRKNPAKFPSTNDDADYLFAIVHRRCGDPRQYQDGSSTVSAFHGTSQSRICPPCVLLRATLILVLAHGCLQAQTASTGALTGITVGTKGAILPGVVVDLFNVQTGTTQSRLSDSEGRFDFSLLAPGVYEVRVGQKQTDPLIGQATVHIMVTEVVRLELPVQFKTTVHSVEVVPSGQIDSPALGEVVDVATITALPLVTRNFTQIAGLSPGITMGVLNAGELGLGGSALSQIANSNDGIFVHGARSYDNNFIMDGISVSDVQGSASGSGGIPIPNPDSMQEFKVQTALYDAAYGRYGGASVSVVTKTGTNALHGTAFEFLRNEVLNANEFFLNRTDQQRPVLKQNQFGAAISGPIRENKLFFFGSYQGTRQVNGVAAGQSRTACTASLTEPPLTNDRTSAALGAMFGGLSGVEGGTAINFDGSNINPVALTLLNLKLPDGDFLIPNPQTVDATKALVQQGFSVLTDPCHFNEDQFVTNLDYVIGQNSRLSSRFFFADDDARVTFPGNGVNPSGNIPGFPSPSKSSFRVFSLAHTYTLSSKTLNQARFGFVRIRTETLAQTAFDWSDIGVAEGEMSHNNELPSLVILGSVSIASGFPRTIAQNSYEAGDVLSLVRGAHSLRLGGSLIRLQDNVNLIGLGSLVRFLSWPDFLLGLSAAQNGSSFSNVSASFDDFGLTTREYRVWEGAAFVQDDYRFNKSVTLNIGLRYEHLGQFGDRLGRNASFDVRSADPNPSPNGSVAGYVVASNFPGMIPPGVLREGNTFGNDGAGQNTAAPRVGFVWRILPNSSRLALRGGYGSYFSRPTGQAFYQNMLGAPFSQFRLNAGLANAGATFQAPFSQPFPTPNTFPLFPEYSSSTATTVYSISPVFRPAMIQQYSLNIETEVRNGWLSEVGYVGTRGTHLVRQRSLNQAFSASADKPIRNVTENTLTNIPMRIPIPGIPPDSLQEMETEGSSWYNALEASLAKRLSRGLQFLASYTFSKILDSDGADINSTSSGNALTLGNQNDPRQRWGRASFNRTHRFVFSTTWTLPSPSQGLPRALLGGWLLSAIATIQSGNALTIAATNSTNVFGISEDRAQLSGQCTKGQLVRGGSVESKLNGYFNASCFTTPPIIGADGIGTAFGNSATGIVDGPGQANLDLAFSKSIELRWPVEKGSLQFRAEFYNALNHPQFANPDSNFTSPTFGVIGSTSVNPRVGQLALKYSF